MLKNSVVDYYNILGGITMVVKSDDLITVREAAQIVGRTAETVRRWIWGGKLHAQKMGNQLFVRRTDLAMLEDRRRKEDVEEQLALLERARVNRERIRRRIGGNIDILDELAAIRERIAQHTGGTLDVLAMLDESRESHP